jgi:hypothetical protein
MKTQVSMLVDVEEGRYNINFSGTFMKVVMVLMMAMVHVMEKFGMNKKSDKALVKGFCQSLSETLFEMVFEEDENEQKLQKDTNC